MVGPRCLEHQLGAVKNTHTAVPDTPTQPLLPLGQRGLFGTIAGVPSRAPVSAIGEPILSARCRFIHFRIRSLLLLIS